MIQPYDVRFKISDTFEICGIVDAVSPAGAIVKFQAELIEAEKNLREIIVTAPTSAFSATETHWRAENSTLTRMPKALECRQYEKHGNSK